MTRPGRCAAYPSGHRAGLNTTARLRRALHDPRAEGLAVFLVLLAAAYFALWACGPRPHSFRPPTFYVPDERPAPEPVSQPAQIRPLGEPAPTFFSGARRRPERVHNSEFGVGGSVKPAQGTCNRHELGGASLGCTSFDLSTWKSWRAGGWLDYGVQLQAGSTVVLAFGGFVRPLFVQTEKIQLGLDLEGGLMAAELGVPFGLQLDSDVCIYTEPSVDLTFSAARFPVGVTLPFRKYRYLAVEGGAMLRCTSRGTCGGRPFWYLGLAVGTR